MLRYFLSTHVHSKFDWGVLRCNAYLSNEHLLFCTLLVYFSEEEGEGSDGDQMSVDGDGNNNNGDDEEYNNSDDEEDYGEEDQGGGSDDDDASWKVSNGK